MNVLTPLREAFPLQQRIEASPADVQAAYAQVLHHWRKHASAPMKESIHPDICTALIDMDAIVLQQGRLGCYPFSAENRGFAVRCSNHILPVQAFCAIDALALPRLLNHNASIESHCTVCGAVRPIKVNASGSFSTQALEQMPLVWVKDHSISSGEICNEHICPNIRFICPTCTVSKHASVFALPQAASIANGFFAFQLRLGRSMKSTA